MRRSSLAYAPCLCAHAFCDRLDGQTKPFSPDVGHCVSQGLGILPDWSRFARRQGAKGAEQFLNLPIVLHLPSLLRLDSHAVKRNFKRMRD